MTPSATDAESDAVGDAEQCVAVADATGERCGKPAIPIADRCHAHVDYADLADADDDPSRQRYARGGTPARGRDTLKSD